jgi:MFS family permease
VEGVSWPWIFWLNVPIGLLLIPFVRTRALSGRCWRAMLERLTGAVLVASDWVLATTSR